MFKKTWFTSHLLDNATTIPNSTNRTSLKKRVLVLNNNLHGAICSGRAAVIYFKDGWLQPRLAKMLLDTNANLPTGKSKKRPKLIHFSSTPSHFHAGVYLHIAIPIRLLQKIRLEGYTPTRRKSVPASRSKLNALAAYSRFCDEPVCMLKGRLEWNIPFIERAGGLTILAPRLEISGWEIVDS